MAGKFRNIRVKMKNGKSRIQRAMVLASGKLKFVKNISRSRSTAPRHKTTKHHSRSVRNTTKKNRKNNGGSAMQAAEKIAKTGAVFATAAMHLMSSGSSYEKGKWILRDYTGMNMDTGNWEPGWMLRGWGPPVGVTIGLKLAHKAIGLIRRL